MKWIPLSMRLVRPREDFLRLMSILLYLGACLFSSGCLGLKASQLTPAICNLEVKELLLDLNDLSSGDWLQTNLPKESPYEVKPRSVTEDLWVRFENGRGDIVTHEVYKFPDLQTARKGLSYSWFYSANRVTQWHTPEWLKFKSEAADHLIFKCAEFSGGYPKVVSQHCRAVVQYNNYISVVTFLTSPPDQIGSLVDLFHHSLELIDQDLQEKLINCR